jgi:hypothetical protein
VRVGQRYVTRPNGTNDSDEAIIIGFNSTHVEYFCSACQKNHVCTKKIFFNEWKEDEEEEKMHCMCMIKVGQTYKNDYHTVSIINIKDGIIYYNDKLKDREVGYNFTSGIRTFEIYLNNNKYRCVNSTEEEEML